jgi:diguanylate cyclase (GGDEF)-like protein
MDENRMFGKSSIIGLILLLVFLFLPFAGLALDPRREIGQYSLSVWSTENGLPNVSVLSVVQGRDGYIWVGTYQGLIRFDGKQFTVFDKSNTPEIEANSIHAIFPDSKGVLWIGTSDGLLSYSAGRFRRYSQTEGLFDNNIYAIYEDRNGVLWVGTNGGLNWLDQERFKGFKTGDGLSDNHIFCIVDDIKGNLWIGTKGGGLNRLRDGQFSHYAEKEGFPGRDVWSLCRNRDGGIWAATSKGLVQISNERLKVFTKKDGLANDEISSVFEDSHGILWLGTIDGKLNRLKDGVFSTLILEKMAIRDRISSIYEDREGSLWIGNFRSGLAQLKDDKFVLYNTSNGLPVNQVRSAFGDRDGNMWFGTVGGGLVRFANGQFFVYGQEQGLKNNRVWSICQGRDGAIWFGTYGGGLHRLKNGKIEVIAKRNGLANDVVRVVFADSKGKIWVGSEGGGIDVIEGEKITNYSTKNGLKDDFVYAINEDREGTIWIGTFNGWIGRFRDGKFDFFSRQELIVSSDKSVFAIYPDADGSVWFGTKEGGLLCFRNNHFTRFSSKDGLYSDVAFQILEDRQGTLWMIGNSIYSVKKSDLLRFAAGQIKRIPSLGFSKSEGINYTEGSGPAQPAGWNNGKGSLYFPTTSGVVLIEPEHIPQNHVPPLLAIEKILVGDKDYPPAPFFRVPAGKGNLEIQYAGLSFVLPDKVLFRFMLEGFDSDWRNVGQRRTAFYTNLPPGSFTFKVMACNNDGLWSTKGAVLAITVMPLYWQTWWFKTILIFCIFLVALLVVHIRMRAIIKKKKELESLVLLRTKELKEAYNEVEKLSITDALTGLYNRHFFISKINKDVALVIRQNSRRTDTNIVFAMGFIMIDLDFFKSVNDRYGHDAGDMILKGIAARFTSTIRASDIVVRWGGEEFLLLSNENDFAGAQLLALRLINAVNREPFHLNELDLNITISIGFCSFPLIIKNPRAFSWEETIKLADKALYIAKQSGRNRAVGIQINPEKLNVENIDIIKNDFARAKESQIFDIVTLLPDAKNSL